MSFELSIYPWNDHHSVSYKHIHYFQTFFAAYLTIIIIHLFFCDKNTSLLD